MQILWLAYDSDQGRLIARPCIQLPALIVWLAPAFFDINLELAPPGD